ncbi:MAG: ankyrin repeat domain-containing protein [Alphaproteobacteria bacterium]|nr:ankyrin repeat domain-containing protein [Alphaproteobacteria bacterium]
MPAADAFNFGQEADRFFAAIRVRSVDDVNAMITDAPNLLRAGHGPNNSGPLHVAAWENRADMIDLFLTHLPVDTRDGMGLTPLQAAAGKLHVEAAARLLEAGADANAKNDFGVSVLATAFTIRHNSPRPAAAGIKMAALLLDHGAQINVPVPPRGETVMELATRLDDRDMLRLFREKRPQDMPPVPAPKGPDKNKGFGI